MATLDRAKQEWIYGILGLLCLASVIFLGKGYESTIPATDTGTYADVAMSVTSQGPWPALPAAAERFGGHWGTAGFNDASFIFMYCEGWVMRFFGPSAWSAKLLPCLFSIGAILLTVWLGAILRSRFAGLLAGLILLFTKEFVGDGLNCHLDTVMAFFIVGSFVFFAKRRYILAGICAALGVWFKSPVALLIVPASFAYWGLRGELRRNFRSWIIFSLVAILGGLSVWGLTGIFGGWELVRDYWVRQVWGTAVGGRGGSLPFQPFLFVHVLRTHYLPWTLFVGWGLVWAVRQKPARAAWRNEYFLLPLLAAAIVIVAISCVRFKYEHYFVPAFPFLSLIAAYPLARALNRFEWQAYRGLGLFALLASAFLLATPISLSPESFPAFRQFSTLIQSYGTCADQVLYVEGYQPYGTWDDYKPLINFYTGRDAILARCEEVHSAALDPKVGWILVSGENFRKCLDSATLARFSKQWISGNQYLLTRLKVETEGSSGIDLTPLYRELQAATDCRPAPLPRDRYHGY